MKKELNRKSTDWTGITPYGDIIINDGNGNSIVRKNLAAYTKDTFIMNINPEIIKEFGDLGIEVFITHYNR